MPNEKNSQFKIEVYVVNLSKINNVNIMNKNIINVNDGCKLLFKVSKTGAFTLYF